MKVVIHVMSSGYNVLVDRPPPAPSLAEMARNSQAAWAPAPPAYPVPQPAPTAPLAAAFSTFEEVHQYLREQFGLDTDDYAQSEAANQCLGASAGIAVPNEDWESVNRRREALALAVKTCDASTSDYVVKTAQEYEQYMRGAEKPATADMLDKSNPDNI